MRPDAGGGTPTTRLARITSGGQTGVDRAALDVALDLGIPCGGWCPRGRIAEDGPIDARYPLQETPRGDPAQRTEWNVRDAEGTLIIAPGPLRGGTALTHRLAGRLGRPCLIIDPGPEAEPPGGAIDAVLDWLAEEGIAVLNVAGPRQSHASGIYQKTRQLLCAVLSAPHDP